MARRPICSPDPIRTMRKTLLLTMLAVLALGTPKLANSQLLDTKVISLDAAKTVLAAAEAEAERNSWTVAIVVVDAGGQLIALHRRDGTQSASVDIAIAKARTSAMFKRPSEALQGLVSGGMLGVLNVEGVMPIQGGIPVIVDGQVIGAVGVSGVSAAQDAQVAEAGVAALRP